MAASKRNNRGAGSNAGTVFWLAAIVIVLFLFALNWGKIQETLARTNFHEIVKTQTGGDKAPDKAPEAPKTPGDKQLTSQDKSLPPRGDAKDSPAKPSDKAAAKDSAAKPAGDQGGADQTSNSAEGSGAENAGAGKPVAEKPATSKPKLPKAVADQGESSRSAVPASSQVAPRNRIAALYFVRIDDDGTIVRQEAKRQIPVSDSPLLDSLDALLKGPSEDELRRNLISLVPEGTKLLSARVQGSTAILNFNEAFMYNHYGIEGYAGQLKQIVYTATAFPTVSDVQILIEGSRRDYLGGEGVYIGKPLSRNSF